MEQQRMKRESSLGKPVRPVADTSSDGNVRDVSR